MKNTLKLFPLTVTLLLCISTAAGLKCFSCSGTACDRVPNPIKQCAATETMCMTRKVINANVWTRTVTTKIEKRCAAPTACPEGGSYVGYEGRTRPTSDAEPGITSIDTSCCSGELCNGDPSSVKLVSCKVCADQEKTCAKVSTMSVIQPTMCVIANVKESPEGPIIKVVKGLAGPPLCSKPGKITFIYGPKTLEVKCCNDADSCNSGPLELEVEVPQLVQSCEVPNYCSLGLHTQLQGLSQGQTVFPPPCCDHT